MSEPDVVAEGRAAWKRLKARERATFDDWVAVGKACAIGRAQSMKAAGCNTPFGKTYVRHMSTWLADNGLAEVHQQERYWALQITDNLVAINAWRDKLDDADRRRWNHPQAIWLHWSRSMLPKTSAHAGHCGRHNHRPKGRPVSFSQDHIRRAATAMRENWCNDVYKLAAIALNAAFRDDIDLAELLPSLPSPSVSVRPPIHAMVP